MPAVTHHAPGTFCWPELATADVHAALEFYSQVFGWGVRKFPVESGEYFAVQVNGSDVAGVYELPPAMRAQNVCPRWAAFVATESADDTARRAERGGGRVLMGPFDAADAGRMAAVADSQGATFNLWESIRHIGACVMNEPGALGWMQLNVRDEVRAKAFYAGVMGWEFRPDPGNWGGSYTTLLKDDVPVGGMMAMPSDAPPDAPSHWLTYFVAADVDATAATAVSLGAAMLVAPRDVAPGLRIAVLADAQGAPFGLMAGQA